MQSPRPPRHRISVRRVLGERKPRRLSINTEVDVETVRRIVAIGDDRLRNHEITLAYWRLGRQFHDLLSVDAANWCTWATWASHTVGHALDPDQHPILVLERTQHWPGPVRRCALRVARLLRTWLNPRMAPAIAEGNREIFAEIAHHFAVLADLLESDDLIDRTAAERIVAGMPMAAPAESEANALVERHRRGLLAYFDARREPDLARRADHILLGNLLMAEYEQARLQPWIEEAFFVRSRKVAPWRRKLQRWIGPAIARWTTRHVTAVITPETLIPVAAPIAAPPDGTAYLSTGEVVELEACRQRLMGAATVPCDNWADYPGRMRAITAMFVAFHDERSLHRPPMSDEARAELETALALSAR